MRTENFKSGGFVVFWHAADTSDRNKLLAGLTDLKLDKYTPEKRTLFAVLKDALSEVVGKPETLIRPLDKSAGFEIVDEMRGDEISKRNTYTHRFAVTLVKDKPEAPPVFSTCDYATEDRILAKYNSLKDSLHSSAITTMLVKIVGAEMIGTSLRDHGGMYWVDGKHAELWAKLSRVVEGVGKNRCYALNIQHDADMIKAVRDALSGEIVSEVKRIDSEIASGELKQRALETRKKEALRLVEKVKEYEAIIGEMLPQLHTQLEEIETAAATAIMAEASAQATGAAA